MVCLLPHTPREYMKLQMCIPRSMRGVELRTYSDLTSALERGQWWAPHLGPPYPQVKSQIPLTLSIRSWVGRRAGLGKEEKISCPCSKRNHGSSAVQFVRLVLKYSVMPDDGFLQSPKHVALFHSLVCYKYSCDWLPSCPLFRSIVTIPTEQSPLFPETQTLLYFTLQKLGSMYKITLHSVPRSITA
jgi:hypothetical protein